MEQTSADMIVRSGNLSELKDADSTKPGKTIWYFDHIPNKTRCFEHTVINFILSIQCRKTREKDYEFMDEFTFLVKNFSVENNYFNTKVVLI